MSCPEAVYVRFSFSRKYRRLVRTREVYDRGCRRTEKRSVQFT
jgi:hypothetical protein